MFESAKLKVERANHHIRDAERQIDIFVKKNFHGIIRQSNTDSTVHVFTMAPQNQFPDGIGVKIGDAVHNLRCALDHLTWEVVGRDDGVQHDKLYFPTGKSGDDFVGACKGIKNISQKVRTMFMNLEAFIGGTGEALYVLSKLDNSDKHRIITPVIKITKVKKFIVRNRKGEVLKRIDWEFDFVQGESFTIDSGSEGSYIDFDNDSEVSTDILFGDVELISYEPVLPTLAQISHAVLNTIKIVERSCG
jgi:hypothetical protein